MKALNLSCLRILALICAVTILPGCEAATDADNANGAVEVAALSASDAPLPAANVNLTARNIYVVFDGSGSMEESIPGSDQFSTRLAGAKWAVHQFIDGLPDNINLGLYVFDQSGSREVLPLGPDNKAEFLSQIDAVVANNGTPLGESIEAAVKALKVQQAKQKPYGEFRLLVVTDGHASDYIGRGVKQANKSGFPLYTIGLGIGQDHELRKESRFYQDAKDAEQLSAALKAAGSELEDYAEPPADSK
ncbi:MAG: VWA domain-containing protein [Candidatus Obscuribacter sp.]|jgi:hypothetical protein|nr:VWA domain-containing protein [Candidatus Obscuribacter sp.]MDQ5964994.1 hypothetical protein [Cyanobacteriota bacterium erpe_2018_sw_39hr_WHONDRS-SW48-000098_B_bin.30]